MPKAGPASHSPISPAIFAFTRSPRHSLAPFPRRLLMNPTDSFGFLCRAFLGQVHPKQLDRKINDFLLFQFAFPIKSNPTKCLAFSSPHFPFPQCPLSRRCCFCFLWPVAMRATLNTDWPKLAKRWTRSAKAWAKWSTNWPRQRCAGQIAHPNGFMSLKSSQLWCPVPAVGTRCPAGSVFHFYRCCGQLNNGLGFGDGQNNHFHWQRQNAA